MRGLGWCADWGREYVETRASERWPKRELPIHLQVTHRHTSYEKLSTFRNNHAECFSNTSCTPAVSSCGTSQKWGHALRRSAHHRHTSPKHHPQNKPQAAPELAGHGKLIKYTRHSQSTEQRLIKAVRGLHSTTKNLVGMATHGTD